MHDNNDQIDVIATCIVPRRGPKEDAPMHLLAIVRNWVLRSVQASVTRACPYWEAGVGVSPRQLASEMMVRMALTETKATWNLTPIRDLANKTQ